jgi:hypothetical protein
MAWKDGLQLMPFRLLFLAVGMRFGVSHFIVIVL